MSFGTTAFGTGSFGTSGAPVSALQLINLYPSDLSVIAPLDAIGFDVVATGLFRRVLVFVAFPASPDPPELAYNGTAFETGYITSRIASLSPTVRRFVIKHGRGGWPSRPTPMVFAFDRTGLEL